MSTTGSTWETTTTIVEAPSSANPCSSNLSEEDKSWQRMEIERSARRAKAAEESRARLIKFLEALEKRFENGTFDDAKTIVDGWVSTGHMV